MLTLPMAGILKKEFVNVEIFFLGKSYTKPIIQASSHIDFFLDYSEIEKLSLEKQVETFQKINADVIIHVFPNRKIAKITKQAKIPIRIGTGRRSFHWFTCNKKLYYSRKKSNLHEAQLNIKLLSALKIRTNYSLDEISDLYGMNKIKTLSNQFADMIDKNKMNLILHPKSKGSAREWGLDNFSTLIQILPKEKFNLFITGTESEGDQMKDFLEKYKNRVIDLTGKLSLTELIQFINQADGLLAASTGPLHIAASLNKIALGIFAPMRPIHPGRWQPIGKKADVFVLNKKCNKCKKTQDCECIREINPYHIKEKLSAIVPI